MSAAADASEDVRIRERVNALVINADLYLGQALHCSTMMYLSVQDTSKRRVHLNPLASTAMVYNPGTPI